jgi:cyclic pyranopterin phosphate synthase
MPKEVFGRDYAFLPRAELLSFEEITQDGAGEIGVITSVTQPPCSATVRQTTNSRNACAQIWTARADRYSEARSAQTAPARKVEMSYIGG